MNYILQNGYVVDPLANFSGLKDVFVRDGLFSQQPAIDAVKIDLHGQLITPGFIDLHVHLRDPGQTAKENIFTGSLAAVKGGFTSICCMPNTSPPLDSPYLIEFVINKAKKAKLAKVYPVATITKGRGGKDLSEMGKLIKAGAIGFSDDGSWTSDSNIMRRAIEYSTNLGSVIMSHAEDHLLSNDGVMNEGLVATSLGLRGIHNSAESLAVARDVELAKHFGKIHISHVSTKEAVNIIRQAKKENIPVTCETAPHYLMLTDEATLNYNTQAKVNPPLRSKADQDAILLGLKDGTIDAIATDHAPHSLDDKNVEFDKATFGISGLETAFALLYTKLVLTEELTLIELLRLLTVNPARIVNLPQAGSLQLGNPADLTIVDLGQKFTVDGNEFASLGKNTPFNGWTLQGVVTKTFVDGRLVFDRE